MPYKDPTDEIKKYKAEYANWDDDKIRGEMSKWAKHAPQYIAGDFILKQRDKDADLTESLLTDLTVRVANIERTATKGEFRRWATWIAVASLLATLVILWLTISQYLSSGG